MLARQDHRESKEYRAYKVMRDQQDHRAILAQQVPRAHRVTHLQFPALPDRRVCRVMLDLRDPQVMLAR